VLREHDLLERRDNYSAADRAAFWRMLGHEPPGAGRRTVSLFAYESAPIGALLQAIEDSPDQTIVAVPEGAAAQVALQHLGADAAAAPRIVQRGALELRIVPFVPQSRYDELLWSCDINFVRGEDSFVRAQWAARPFAWHIYPTDDGAHWIKMAAFLARYTEALDRNHAAAVTALWEAWNRGDDKVAGDTPKPSLGEAWPAFTARRELLRGHAAAWSGRLAARPDLAAALVDFCDNVVK